MSIELIQAAQQALEALTFIRRQLKSWDRGDSVIDALRTALTQQPATTEPVQADSSEHLRVIASLGDALRRLSFAAQTTGGTAGPDAELQSAIGQAEQALSLGGIWQAMSATGEPVMDVRCEGCGYMTHHREHMGCVRAAKQHTHQTPSVPMTNEQWDDVLGSAGLDMFDLAKQWSNNEVHVYQVVNEAEKIVKAAVLRGITAQAKKEGA